MSIKKFFLVLLISLRSAIQTSSEPIYGKNVQIVDRKQYEKLTFVVSLGRLSHDVEGAENHFCTGSLISRRHVLTSAHCMDDEDIDDIVVTIGTNDLKSGFKHSLGSVHIYADWAMENNEIPDEYLDDICILKLKERVRDKRIVPVSLKYDVLYVKQTVTLAGWGASDNDKTIPRFMETISLPVQPMQECNRKLEKILDYKVVQLPMLYLCTFTDPEALLRCGDSGGPVLNENYELIAINDATCPLANHHPGLVNLHVNVYFYKKFIEATLRNEN